MSRYNAFIHGTSPGGLLPSGTQTVMLNKTIKRLPLGTSSFEALRKSNLVYVDKTELIFRMAVERGKFFLARPRRFGKSLLISTLASLFQYGLRDFEGLAIEKLWKDETYHVIRMDFSTLKDFENKKQFLQSLISLVVTSFAPLGFVYDRKSADAAFLDQFKAWLSSLEANSIVILIDEYDAPLTAHLDKKRTFNTIRNVLEGFYAAIKENDKCLRFFFMTGITKFSNTSIFSAFNAVTDLSLNPVFGTLLGYTTEEIKKNFTPYLGQAAELLKVSEKTVLSDLQTNYDGFSFDERAESHVFCPWSVLNFFAFPQRGYRNYWYESGGQPTVLTRFLVNHSLQKPIHYAEIKEIPLSELEAAHQYNDADIKVLLVQAGYLTLKNVTTDKYAQVGYPNQEVAVSMAQLYAAELVKGRRIRPIGAPMLSDVMATRPLEEIMEQFNYAMNVIDYKDYPVKNEAACRAYLQLLLVGAAMLPQIEVHSAHGRSDLEVNAGRRRWVFEIKCAASAKSVERLLKAGIRQIRDKGYGKTPHGKELHRAVLVFNKEARQFTAWQAVD